MANWQLTATTIFCDTCGGEATIIIYKDGQVKCTGGSVSDGKNKKIASYCSAATCKQVADYKAKLAAEEQVG